MAINKLLLYDSNPDITGESSVHLLSEDLSKTAFEINPAVLEFLSELGDPSGNKARALITALSAYDSFGANKNGDGFHRDHLLRENEYEKGGENLAIPMYKSFEHFARPYRHHINRPTSPSYGEVLHASFNDRMDRVELVVEVDADKAPDIIRAIENYEPIATSMGFRAKYDVCSVCGNIAKTRRQYCNHLRTKMLSVMPDGQLVYAINPFGKFFDISFVKDPADLTSRAVAVNQVLEDTEKVASNRLPSRPVYLSSDLAKVADYDNLEIFSKLSQDKPAYIRKRIGSEAEVEMDPETLERLRIAAQNMKKSEPEIDKEAMAYIADRFDFPTIASTFSLAGVSLKPQEAQYMALRSGGFPKTAENLYAEGVIVSGDTDYEWEVSAEHLNDKLAAALSQDSDLLQERSYYPKWFNGRLDKIAYTGVNPYISSHRAIEVPQAHQFVEPSESEESGSVFRYLLAMILGAKWARNESEKAKAKQYQHGHHLHAMGMPRGLAPSQTGGLLMTAPVGAYFGAPLGTQGPFADAGFMETAMMKEGSSREQVLERLKDFTAKLPYLDKVATRVGITPEDTDLYGRTGLDLKVLYTYE